MTELQLMELDEAQLLVYGELGDWLDRYARLYLGSPEHCELTLRIVAALNGLEAL